MSENEITERRIAEIEEAIHQIHMNKLVNIDEYIKKLKELAAGEASVRDELGKAGTDSEEVKRLVGLAKTYVNEKNILREIRYTIKLTDIEEQRLETMKAKLLAQKVRR